MIYAEIWVFKATYIYSNSAVLEEMAKIYDSFYVYEIYMYIHFTALGNYATNGIFSDFSADYKGRVWKISLISAF